jgi:hypothetical protein
MAPSVAAPARQRAILTNSAVVHLNGVARRMIREGVAGVKGDGRI